jgi:hypothetical protein
MGSLPCPCTSCTSQTVKSGQVQTVTNQVRWLRRPQVRPQGWGFALLAIDHSVYKAEASWAAAEAGVAFQFVDLTRVDTGDVYHLTLGHADDQCSCPHQQFRGVVCRHLAAVRAALAWLETRERAEWELAAALQALGEADVSVPF